jgi:large subunit ribosomal protein L20
MTRIKRAVGAKKKRAKLKKRVKGFLSTRRGSIKRAKEAVMKAETYAYRDRKAKKRTMRQLWQVRINAAVRQFDLSYSKFINLLKQKNVLLDRKVLANLAAEKPEAFKQIIELIKK